ncbi:MAG: agmatinase [Dissulfurimicrobium sp.]|uniref:agmatinase n=1 Tax=Dissulfurimicrobium TaxID=1769732 RepID=UPI001EDAB23F|nr:agmatinase [Dissulfurimicrobium hydrothermale]UKL13636.1 agmatinase [Dissulfurimicrobium hydrothermale]
MDQFLGLSSSCPNRDQAKAILVPVPFDLTTCYKAGARDGPARIIEASPHMEFYDEETDSEAFRKGIFTATPIEPELPPENMVRKVREAVIPIVRSGQIPCVIGGDHSVSIGAIEAIYSELGRLNLVHFDAHTDLRDSYLGSRYSHACVMRRVWGLGDIIQIGVRAVSREEMEFLKGQRHWPTCRPIWANMVIEDREASIAETISRLKQQPTYVTIDLDCLDPSIMPAVGTPEPGGLSWSDITKFLKAIAASTMVVGFDVVELAPIPGYHAADFLAARLIYKFLSYIFNIKNLIPVDQD